MEKKLYKPEDAEYFCKNAPLKSAADLAKNPPPPVPFLIGRLIPKRYCLLAAASRVGKTEFAWQLAASVLTGRPFLGRKVNEQGGVIYLDLESDEEQINERAERLGVLGHPNLFYPTEDVPTLDESIRGNASRTLIPYLDWAMDRVENPQLIVIDVLEKVRGNKAKDKNAYEKDAPLGKIRRFAADKGITILALTHRNKLLNPKAAPNVYETINGSAGIRSTAHSVYVMDDDDDPTRERVKLSCDVRGKNVESGVIQIRRTADILWVPDQKTCGNADPLDDYAVMRYLKKVYGPDWMFKDIEPRILYSTARSDGDGALGGMSTQAINKELTELAEPLRRRGWGVELRKKLTDTERGFIFTKTNNTKARETA